MKWDVFAVILCACYVSAGVAYVAGLVRGRRECAAKGET